MPKAKPRIECGAPPNAIDGRQLFFLLDLLLQWSAESPAARSKYSAASALSFSDTDGVEHPFASRTHRSA